jgi:hypothetical protein
METICHAREHFRKFYTVQDALYVHKFYNYLFEIQPKNPWLPFANKKKCKLDWKLNKKFNFVLLY